MSKKKPAFLKEENLLTLLSQNNFIVPEIQREYVWGENEKVITEFLKNVKNKIGICCTRCNLPASENKINIGFLYSYKPEYVKIEHERFLDENLIDGQQRFTTLFLLLFVCALKENRKGEFLSLIRFEEKLKMCFDFRVRDLTKRFLLELVEKVENTEQLKEIDKQTWFLKDYQNDVSIKSMQKALGFIQTIFSDNTRYYNHLINYIVFWHFKTEATSQGEELYITMNARGEELADNEVTKAALMIDDSDLYNSGEKWEELQQFFWKNRNKNDTNPSADKGFNGFLSCIAGLEFYLKDKAGIKAEKDIQKLLTLDRVKEYYNAFKFLIESKNEFAEDYTYSEWIDKCLNEIWSVINDNQTDWFANYLDKNKSTERNRMIFIWSWLYYITEANREGKTIQINELYRILRFFYIRYNNFNRSVTTLKKTLDLILINGIWDTLDNEMGNEDENPEEETDTKFRTTEETIKNVFLHSKITETDLLEIEELIWQIEDHPLNLDGKDVGNINITHLIELNIATSLVNLQNLKDCFESLFPNKTKSGSSILKTILLYYGDFWKNASNQSYYRYDFSDWKRNIRKIEFKTFINDLVGKSADILLENLKTDFLKENQTQINDSALTLPNEVPLRKKLSYYSIFLPSDELWREGEKIIICDDTENEQRLFEDENKIIYNSKGTFHGYTGNRDLWKLLIQKTNNPLQELKNKVSEQLEKI
jgi:hypothetical protein